MRQLSIVIAVLSVLSGCDLALERRGATSSGQQGCNGRDDLRSRDECTMRRALELPDEVTLVALDGVPSTPGAWQREGLRIDATFEVPPARRAELRARLELTWDREPAPARVAEFRDPPPSELTARSAALHLCRVHVYRPNTNIVDRTLPCAEAPERFDSYLIATYDEPSGRLRGWLKHYF